MIVKEIRVAVLMSTYNGQKYIKEQLDSILTQRFDGEITVFVRDDGSKDSTRDIVKEVANNCGNSRKIQLLEKENIGVQKSFLELIQYVPEYDYYFFADQDDIWKIDKVQRAVQLLDAGSEERKVYCSDYSITNENMEILYESQVSVDEKTFNPLRLLFYNVFPGCIMAFDKGIMNVLKSMNVSNCMMHDGMVMAIGALTGKIYYDSSSTILHRIHSNNVVGHGRKKINIIKWIKDKTRLLFKKENYDVSEIDPLF